VNENTSTGFARLTRAHTRQLAWLVALAIGVAMPLMIAVWIVASRALDWDVVFTARIANVGAMALLVAMISAPLLLSQHSWPARKRGYVIVWFSVSLFFNLVWQLPLILFRDTITNAPVTAENLPRYISWWGYGSADSHYGTVSRFMVASESWWLVAMAVAITGLVALLRGAPWAGYLLMGIGGALQAYNASFYVVDNGFVDHFHNVATDSPLGPLLYFGFAAIWVGAAITASVFSFGMLRPQTATGPSSRSEMPGMLARPDAMSERSPRATSL
jgi:hypothetical protein